MILPEFAKHWAQELGTTSESLIQLRGGINNRVFRCGSVTNYWVIKGYPPQQAGQQDRMQAEAEFLSYANLVTPIRVPELIEIDSARRCLVLQHVSGEAYPEGITAPNEDVQAAISFFSELNINLETARSMIKMDASEGFLSLKQHMQNVCERISSMDIEHLPVVFKDKGRHKLVQLRKQAMFVEKNLEAQIISGEVEDALDPQDRCLSPGDFGFHNAIKTTQGIKFIDFEFAGWDDPAKAAIDFLLQPRVPIPRTMSLTFSGWLKCQTRKMVLRQNALKPIIRLKWVCIILGFLKPERLASMLQVNQGTNIEKLIDERFASANQYINEF